MPSILLYSQSEFINLFQSILDIPLFLFFGFELQSLTSKRDRNTEDSPKKITRQETKTLGKHLWVSRPWDEACNDSDTNWFFSA